jgi:hypothetical protein
MHGASYASMQTVSTSSSAIHLVLALHNILTYTWQETFSFDMIMKYLWNFLRLFVEAFI